MVEDGDTIVDWLTLGEVEKATDDEAMIILEDDNALGNWLGVAEVDEVAELVKAMPIVKDDDKLVD